MGVVLAKFRKQKTTYQILEKLEEDIKEAEALTISTKEKQRRFIVNLYLVSIGLLVIGCLLYYFYFLPPTWSKRIVYTIPLLAASVFVICLGRLGSWFFQKRLNKNSTNLTKLREEKKKIIEKVMDTETYKVAIELLNRFGDKTNDLKVQSNTGAITQSPVPSTLNNRNLTQARNRIGQSPQVNTLDRTNFPSTPLGVAPKTPISNNPSRAYVSPYSTPSSNYQLQYRTQVKTPFPIINQNEKKFFDKILDFLMGEGQSSLYGMVCKECYGHNGMVSLEEYEYSAFRCAFCKVLNPAKKIRPKAPALSIENIGSTIQSSSSTSSSDKDSGSETEEKSNSLMTGSLPLSGAEDVSHQQVSGSESNVEPSVDDDNVQPSQLSEEKLDENVEEKSAIDKKTD
ncbi:endoplasmic reticulum junction formation protein lunapark-B isoform X2 [Bradysia coprophila]|uniref:endoplasmic reticulum junction formation protein lunapark-B isoform X2 n=1 Tax=Bradysia coprophila TaxID=38358 RepID=UPI00187DB52D|nr:endoplasmic reticulum junction formation protein lunapark-B isoform X2 [Bradysia coprophila]